MRPLLVARLAMATRFEFVLYGADPVRLRAIAEEALDNIERIENLLSLYRPYTDIARINSNAAKDPVRVMPETFQLLERARALTELTRGAFDITAGPLVRAWGFTAGRGADPDPKALEEAREGVGWKWVELDPNAFTVRLLHPRATLDLGAIGKGYALDCAAQLLQEAGIVSGLLHGGTSTVVALGTPPHCANWTVALPEESTDSGGTHATVSLRDESLSVSAPWGRSFTDSAGALRGHILDPRSGGPVAHSQSAAVAAKSAADSDALSTALSVGGPELASEIAVKFPEARLWVGSVPLRTSFSE